MSFVTSLIWVLLKAFILICIGVHEFLVCDDYVTSVELIGVVCEFLVVELLCSKNSCD